MSSETDSSASSTSSEEYKKRKTSKKSKRKSEKKHKKEQRRHKKKKRLGREEPKPMRRDIGNPTETPLIPSIKTGEIVEDVDAFGPALPPHLLKDKQNPTIIGPVLPDALKNITVSNPINSEKTEEVNTNSNSEEEDGDETSYGPKPFASGSDGAQKMSATQIELEERALQLKLAAIEGTPGASVDTKIREEWMLELPEVGLKSGLAALSNLKRTFHQGKERPDFSDRSAWTKTPQDALGTVASTSKPTTVDTLKRNAEEAYQQLRDKEQERQAKKHKKKHKREESLLELHQKKLRKEQKRKEKELAESGAKPERRPFSRDVDLKLNQIDKNQTKQIVDKAKLLNSKFASGHTKYL